MNESVFDGKSNIYDKFRPSYPSALLCYFCSALGVKRDSIIADIGSGTGILTQLLLDNVCKVFAVEPNKDMRTIAESKLKGICGFVSIDGSAENTMLLEKSVSYITVAQAFHWFDRLAFKKECARVLKPNGKVILLWNCRDENSELVQEIDSINKKYCPNFTGFLGGMRGARNKYDFNDFFDGTYEEKSFENNLLFNEQRFIGLHQSASYAPDKNDIQYRMYLAELRSFFSKHSSNGTLVMQNMTLCYVGKV
jgi:ubiquinone/menaquinone biosynthesis C-methylase UbiE